MQTIGIVGDSGVGKTAYINQLSSGKFSDNYTPTIGIYEVQTKVPHLEHNQSFRMKEISELTSEGLYGLQGIIIMFDITNIESYMNGKKWYELIRKLNTSEIPIVLVGNKLDLAQSRQVMPKNIKLHRELKVSYYEISAKGMYNYEKPILSLFGII